MLFCYFEVFLGSTLYIEVSLMMRNRSFVLLNWLNFKTWSMEMKNSFVQLRLRVSLISLFYRVYEATSVVDLYFFRLLSFVITMLIVTDRIVDINTRLFGYATCIPRLAKFVTWC